MTGSGTAERAEVRPARGGAGRGKRRLLGRADDALDYELLLCFCAGVLRQRLRNRRTPAPHEALAPR